MNKFKALVATALIASLATSNIVVAMDSGNTDEKDWSENWEGHPPVVAVPGYVNAPSDPALRTASAPEQELELMDTECKCGHNHNLAEAAVENQALEVGQDDGQISPNKMTALLVTKMIVCAIVFSALSTLAIKNIDVLGKKVPFKPKHKESKDALKKILGSTVTFSLLGAVGSYLITKFVVGSKKVDNQILKTLHLSAKAAAPAA